MITTTQRLSTPLIGTYTIDPVKSTVIYMTRSGGLNKAAGTFTLLAGTIEVTASSIVAVRITLDANNFSSHNKTRDMSTSARFLDAAGYPQITYKATIAAPVAANTTVDGILTVREIAVPVPLTIQSAEVIDGDLHLSAFARVDRSAFGVKRWKAVVARALPVTIHVVAHRFEKAQSGAAAGGLSEKRFTINESGREKAFVKSRLL